MANVVQCACGARVRIPDRPGGKAFRCPRCKSELVSAEDELLLVPSPAPAGIDATCPICQTAIAAGEPAVTCPECDQVHHEDCWEEIGGCSTYGCAQAPAAPKEATAAPRTAWGDTKECPSCGETIRSTALRCRDAEFHFDQASLENLDPKIGRAMRANVLIQTRQGLLGGTSLGSGVILSLSGAKASILTNRHVIDPDFEDDDLPGQGDGKPAGAPLEVTMVDQTVRTGRVVWQAPAGIDLALVEVDLPTAEARAARWKVGRRRPRIGDPVFAVGNPLGLSWTHTQGAVSQFRIQEKGPYRLRVIQTQTSLNPGNSGGGLYDSEGYLIAVNTWSKDKRVSEGLSFSISVEALESLRPPGLDLVAGNEEPDRP